MISCLLLQFAIECREDVTQSPWLEILSHSCSPFWPVSTETRKKAVARIKDSTLETLPFDITEAHTTLLQLQHDVSHRLNVNYVYKLARPSLSWTYELKTITVLNRCVSVQFPKPVILSLFCM